MYDGEAARKRFLELGCTPEEADTLVRGEVEPDVVGADARSAVPFVEAALYHDLWDINGRLADADDNGDAAWEEWAKNSIEGRTYDEDDEDGDEDEDEDGEDGEDEDGEDEDEEEDGEIYGWVRASIGEVGPGEFSIDLYDDLGMPGNGRYVKALSFSVPALTAAASEAERDACVIEAAIEEFVDHGLVPDSDFRGGGDSFSVVVRREDRAVEWLEAQRRQQAEFRAAIPAWAVQLAAHPEFQAATLAHRAMLASNFLYARNHSADTPELVHLLSHAAAEHLD